MHAPREPMVDLFRRKVATTYAQLVRTAGRPDAQAIHDLRVALRRCGEVLQVMDLAGLLSHRKIHRGLRSLRRLRRLAGQIRDWDVLTARVKSPKRATRQGERRRATGSAALEQRRWLEAAARRRQRRLAKLKQLLEAALGDGYFDRLERRLIAPDAAHLGLLLAQALEARLAQNQRKFRQACTRAVEACSPESAHRARIAGKRLRYAWELATESGLWDGRGVIRRLKKLQTITGQLHDTQFALQHAAVQSGLQAADKMVADAGKPPHDETKDPMGSPLPPAGIRDIHLASERGPAPRATTAVPRATAVTTGKVDFILAAASGGTATARKPTMRAAAPTSVDSQPARLQRLLRRAITQLAVARHWRPPQPRG